jgi:5-methylcytosine-specific restriction protein A
MPTMPPTYRPLGRSARERARLYERDRGSARDRLYGSLWASAARAHITCSPFCRYCELEGRATAAELVDHFYPHRGNLVLFWDQRFWVSSCKSCHSSMKQSTECQGLAALQALARRLGLPPLNDAPGGIKSVSP